MERDKHSISVRVNGKIQQIKEDDDKMIDPNAVHEDKGIIPQPDNVIDFGKLKEKRERDGQPFWDDGNREKSPKLPFRRKKKAFGGEGKSRLPLMLIAALFSAVAVGLSLGFIILAVFTSNTEGVADAGVLTAATIPTFVAKGASLPVLTTEVVQGGAFSGVEKGTEVVTRIKDQGFAAVLTTETDPLYMFIGVGGDRAQADQISSLYEKEGQETYIKSYQIDGQVVTGQANDVTAWFDSAIDHYKNFMQLTVDGFGDGAMVTAEKIQELDESISSLQAGRDSAFTKLPENVQVSALAMGDALVSAHAGLDQFSQSNDRTSLWKTQQALLDTLIHYDQIVRSMK